MRTLLALATASVLAACASAPDVRVTEIDLVGPYRHEAFRATAVDRKSALEYSTKRCTNSGHVVYIAEEAGGNQAATGRVVPLSGPIREASPGGRYYWMTVYCVTPQVQALYEKSRPR